ncbi:hypothetical protein B0F90DRAFT_1730947 [Multifurca ochricompacta]|uniref:Uncharacterized protein n=1 Tax=Multifurca ochricompacta TaxID=376703 RepID=A0AAD4M413_9AGAM|nr:hypothetical protein B0F90DRAFT_1730947 [Multifurca ochricompacta]
MRFKPRSLLYYNGHLMKINAHTAIVGDTVVLVPYRTEHVETYHTWMQNPQLRDLTASEELTLEEEHAMQQSWQEDEDKLTFIVLARRPLRPPSPDSDEQPSNNGTATTTTTTTEEEDLKLTINDDEDIKSLPMIGDVNLFFKNQRGDPEFEVECEVMIAGSCLPFLFC